MRQKMGRPGRYRWDEWFSKGTFTLVQGRDYDCSQVAISGQVRNVASKRRVRASIEDGGDRVKVTVGEKRSDELPRESSIF